jgi:hypothetical protein
MKRLTQLVLASLLCITIAQGAELTINPSPAPVGPQPTLTGKAPSADAKVFLIVNPAQAPQQFWVQKLANVDAKRNWLCSIHVGDPGSGQSGQQFVVVAVADPNDNLREGDVLSGWPSAKWISQPITLTRK